MVVVAVERQGLLVPWFFGKWLQCIFVDMETHPTTR